MVAKGTQAAVLNQLFTEIDERLHRKSEVDADEEAIAYSLTGALRLQPESNLVVISVPGQYAVREAEAAVDQDLNVFLFSSNVSLEDELRLKKKANATITKKEEMPKMRGYIPCNGRFLRERRRHPGTYRLNSGNRWYSCALGRGHFPPNTP